MVLQVSSLSKQIVPQVEGAEPLSIIHDLSLQVEAGESVAIMGASGSGKSTLLALLAGLDQPTSGEIRLLDHAMHQLDEEERAHLRLTQVGFIFQSFHLIPTLTALQNVAVPLNLLSEPSARVEQRAVELLNALGLEARHHHLPVMLSGGEQQRVAIARALIAQPAIIFADEPTGNLDRVTSDHVCEQLFHLESVSRSSDVEVEIATETAATSTSASTPALVVVTHDPQVAARCQRTLHLVDGALQS